MIAIVRQELRDALRNRWLGGYAAALALLGLVAAWAGLRGSEGMALQTFGRTSATLTNLCLFLAPLVSLVLGASAIAGERDRGTLEYLLAQPVTRAEVVLGKYLGLLLSLAGATLVGFAPAGALIASRAGGVALAHFLVFPLISILLVASMLALGLLLSARAATAVAAQGLAVLTWFALVLLYDLVLLGVLVGAGVGPATLAVLLLANPVDAARILVVLALEPDLYLLGPAGAWLLGQLSAPGTAVLLAGAVLGWAAIGLGTTLWLFRSPRQADVRSPAFRALATTHRFTLDSGPS
ncbi:MAG TPA: ABC transporter permease [Thermoanaerobaculia bacterium]|nr:ABC transporter permease [Thermoanaerobaculia bacterium]